MRRRQVPDENKPYLALVAPESTMLYWLAKTCREARETAGRRQVQVAASVPVDQSTIQRFENATAWPRNADSIIAAYADDLDVSPELLWQAALQGYLTRNADDLPGHGLTER